MTDRRELSPERKALLDAAVADGWPIRQIIATYGIGTHTVKRYYPGYAGMSAVESGRLAMAIRHTNRKLAS
jgi:transposase